MTLVNPKPGGHVSGEVLPPDEMDDITESLPKALDGVGGGTYTPSAALIINGAGLESSVAPVDANDLTNKAFVDSRFQEVDSRRTPATGASITRDLSGPSSADYEPELGAFVMTDSGGLKWTQTGTSVWTQGSSLPGSPGGAQSGYEVKAGAGCVLVSHGTASASTARLWRSTNGGSSYSGIAVPSGVNRPLVWRVSYATWIMEPQDGTGNFYRSTNHGASFTLVGLLRSGFSGIKYFARSPISGTVIAGAVDGSTRVRQILLSTDDGASWTDVTLPGDISTVTVVSLGWTPVLGFFAACKRGTTSYFYSSQNGTVWVDAMGVFAGPHGTSWDPFSSVVSLGRILLAACGNRQLWSVAGVGATWYNRGAIGLTDPLMVPEVWPIFNGALYQRPAPFILSQTAPSSNLTVIA